MTPNMIPVRGLLLVTPIDPAEHFAGGAIIIPAESRERLTVNQFEVVAVGAFAECEDEECERPHETLWDEFVPVKVQAPDGVWTDSADCLRVHPHPVRVGDWILCAPRSAIAGPDPERSERFVHQDAVLGIFNEE